MGKQHWLCVGVALSALWNGVAAAQTVGALSAVPNPTPAVTSSFGTAVATGGGMFAVGSPGDTSSGVAGGAVFLYNGAGSLVRTLTDPGTPAAGEMFGGAVAMSGTQVLVGATHDGGPRGRAFLFDATTGALLQTFSSPAASGSGFGTSVALANGMALIGATFDPGPSVGSGAAYLFDVATGGLLKTFNNPTPALSDSFGQSVALAGGRALVGAPLDDAITGNSGAAHLFDVSSGALLQSFTNPSPGANDQFGTSVALSATHALVGAPFDKTNGSDSGAAYVFSAATGTLEHSYLGGVAIRLGTSVAMTEEFALISSSRGFVTQYGDGSVGLYDATTWALLATIDNPHPQTLDHFGLTVALAGHDIVIGSNLDNTFGTDQGIAFLTAIQPVATPAPGGAGVLAVGLLGLAMRRGRMAGRPAA